MKQATRHTRTRLEELPLARLLTASEAARVVPGRPHTSAIHRWARTGLENRSGVRVRLRIQRAGRRTLVRVGDLIDFFRRLGE